MVGRGVGAATLALGVVYLVGALRLPEAMLGDPAGPRLLPQILAWALILLGAALVVRPGPDPLDPGPVWGGGVRLFAAVALLFVYPAVLPPAGYLLATAAVLFALLLVYNPGRLALDAAVAVGFAVASWVVFHRLLGVYVPKGLLG
jgi:putative tricarboxylic transport membrane protein